jgi:hypothetical protein
VVAASRIQDLALHGRQLEHQRHQRERGGGCDHRGADALQHAAAVTMVAARFEIAEDRRHDQYRFQALPENQDERHEQGNQRRGDARRAELALDSVEAAPQLPGDLVDLAPGRSRLHRVPQLRVVLLQLEGHALIAHPQWDLDELEVVQVRVPRCGVGLVLAAVAVELGAALDLVA